MLEHRETSRRREPSSLRYYHGTMCSDLAADILMRESPGTFLVWRVVNTDQIYLSYKTVNTKTILHSKINFTHDSNCYIEEAEVTSTSIRRLVESLKTLGLLTIGLTQLCRVPTISANNSLDLSDLDTEDESESSSVLNIPFIPLKEAEKTLEKSPLGTWLLRSNKEGDLRVSFKSSTKVKHKMLHQREGELFTMTEEDTETPVSLLEIIVKLKEQGMITNRYSNSSDSR